MCVCEGGGKGGAPPCVLGPSRLRQRTDRSTIDRNRSWAVGNQRSVHRVTLMPAEVPVLQVPPRGASMASIVRSYVVLLARLGMASAEGSTKSGDSTTWSQPSHAR